MYYPPARSDDSWLEIAPEQLDEMMRKAAGYLPNEEVSLRLEEVGMGG